MIPIQARRLYWDTDVKYFLTQPNIGIILVGYAFFCDLSDIMSIHVKN